ncbi:tetratricopeptide repeat protein [Spirosoma sp. BT702]|uniref:histidine kinase n=1 Tax=Spirosoma profusum TaxID=2771354 RepID=A0A927AMW9_9BACT|nr:histidine kinase dimerization/phosphoacceptor domain -containing protein [Spirosoma profusum]MBD2700649.1 tetratricopeptide repeat protein [Spirosoma profusum]
MYRLTLCISCLFVLWLIGPHKGVAQEQGYLKLRTDRIQNARGVEQQALAQNDSGQLAEAWYLYGKTYAFAGDYHTAQRYFLKSLRIQEPRGDSDELSRLYVRLSENEDVLGRPEQAIQLATRALQIAQRIKQNREKALIRSNGTLGRIYEGMWLRQVPRRQTLYDSILTYYRKELNFCYIIKDTAGIAESTMHLGTFLTRGNDERAIPYLKQALDFFTQKNKDGIRVRAMANLAAAYLTFDKPDSAIQVLQKAEQFYGDRKLNEYDVRMLLEHELVRYYEKTGQWPKAYTHLRQLNALERGQILSDRDGAISRLSVEYETEKKETLLRAQNKEIKLNEQNLRLQRLVTWTTIILFLLASGISVVFFRLYRKNRRISRQNQELVKEQNHRVKNNLQIVSSLLNLQAQQLPDPTARRAVEESQMRVQAMAILHRRLYDGEQLARVDLNDFVRELVSSVLETFGYANVAVELTIEPIYLSADKAIPLGLILNELITNSCKYAFPDNDSPTLCISCRQKGRNVHLEVADNGPGLAKTQVPVLQGEDWNVGAQGSFGMSLIQAQVAQLNGVGHFEEVAENATSGTVFVMDFNV